MQNILTCVKETINYSIRKQKQKQKKYNKNLK